MLYISELNLETCGIKIPYRNGKVDEDDPVEIYAFPVNGREEFEFNFKFPFNFVRFKGTFEKFRLDYDMVTDTFWGAFVGTPLMDMEYYFCLFHPKSK